MAVMPIQDAVEGLGAENKVKLIMSYPPPPLPPPLLEQALDLLYRNLQQDTFFYNATISKFGHQHTVETINVTWSYSSPCTGVSGVQESTSTLLAARAFAKAGNVTLAWESLRALFAGQQEDGFLPKYRYQKRDDDHDDNDHDDNDHDDNDHDDKRGSNDDYYLNETSIPGPKLGSHLSALPLHASIVLDVYAWSSQSEVDLQHLVDLYGSIYKYHAYMVQHPISHPWEVLWDVHSWIEPLRIIRDEMKASGWTMPFSVPTHILQSYDYLPEVYEPCIYLLECYNSMDDNATNRTCPTLESVDHAAIWVQAHRDLMELRNVLQGRHADWEVVDFPAERPAEWLVLAEQKLERLWEEQYQTFLPKWNNETLVVSDASSFVGLWSDMTDQSNRVYNLASKLMQHPDHDTDRMSFDCGFHSVWSRGGCQHPSTISPLLNYLIATGLHQNKVYGMGYYIANATTDRLFSDHLWIDFAIALEATSGQPFDSMDNICARLSTTSAAVVYNLATFTPPRIIHPDPPIRNSGVIFLIIVEVVVAFAIGATCVLLNLRILREALTREEHDEYERLEQEDGGFFSASGSFGHRREVGMDDNDDGDDGNDESLSETPMDDM